MNNTQANQMTLEQVRKLSPSDAAAYLNALINSHDVWTREDARHLLRAGAWANGEALAENERAAVEVIANAAKDVNY